MKLNVIYNGDCLIESDNIESGSVDLILTDLPYGTMNGFNGIDWDFAIDPKKVYEIANRVLRKNGKMVLFSQEPYTGQLTTQAIPNVPFSYRMIWRKDNFANALLCNKAPVSYYEDILVFSKDSGTIEQAEYSTEHPLRGYFNNLLSVSEYSQSEVIEVVGSSASHYFTNGRQFRTPTADRYAKLKEMFPNIIPYERIQAIHDEFMDTRKKERLEYLSSHRKKYPSTFNLWEGGKYKSNILRYKKDYDGYHPTQKPVLLLEDLVKTFSNEGDLVVDLTIGSGSTAVACINTNRNYIGFELDKHYCDIANERIQKALAEKAVNA